MFNRKYIVFSIVMLIFQGVNAPENRQTVAKGNNPLPTIHFQGQFVRFREGHKLNSGGLYAHYYKDSRH